MKLSPIVMQNWLWQWKVWAASAHAAAASTNPLRQQGRTLQRAVHQHE